MQEICPPCDVWAVRRNSNLTHKLNCISDSLHLLNCDYETAIPMCFGGMSQVPSQTVLQTALMWSSKKMLLRFTAYSRRGMAWKNSWVLEFGLAHVRSCCPSLSHDVRRFLKWVFEPTWVRCLPWKYSDNSTRMNNLQLSGIMGKSL